MHAGRHRPDIPCVRAVQRDDAHVCACLGEPRPASLGAVPFLRTRVLRAGPKLLGVAPGEVDGTVAPDSDDEFEDDLEIEEVAVSAEDMARLRAGGASDDDDDDLLVEEVQLSPEEVEKLRAGGDDDDDDLLVEEVQMSPEEVEKLRAGEESSDDDLQIEEVQMSHEELYKLRAGEQSSDDECEI